VRLKNAYRKFLAFDVAVGAWFGGVLRRFWSVWLVLMVGGLIRIPFERGGDLVSALGSFLVWVALLLYIYISTSRGRIFRQRKYRDL
jgi:hypothetical protein